jgi:hypothetical protein
MQLHSRSVAVTASLFLSQYNTISQTWLIIWKINAPYHIYGLIVSFNDFIIYTTLHSFALNRAWGSPFEVSVMCIPRNQFWLVDDFYIFKIICVRNRTLICVEWNDIAKGFPIFIIRLFSWNHISNSLVTFIILCCQINLLWYQTSFAPWTFYMRFLYNKNKSGPKLIFVAHHASLSCMTKYNCKRITTVIVLNFNKLESVGKMRLEVQVWLTSYAIWI